jgi:hypothetical protein
MRINDEVKEIIQYNQNAGETFNDTVLRMFREKAEEIKKVREENDRLTQELDECKKFRTTVEYDVPEAREKMQTSV